MKTSAIKLQTNQQTSKAQGTQNAVFFESAEIAAWDDIIPQALGKNLPTVPGYTLRLHDGSSQYLQVQRIPHTGRTFRLGDPGPMQNNAAVKETSGVDVVSLCGNFLTLRLTRSEMEKGAAHPQNSTTVRLFDLESGRTLELKDVVGDERAKQMQRFVTQRESVGMSHFHNQNIGMRVDASGGKVVDIYLPGEGLNHQNIVKRFTFRL